VIRAERKIEAAARRFQSEGIDVRIRHFLHGQAKVKLID
jgi:hypothetical protein